jgi:hypothetical protein
VHEFEGSKREVEPYDDGDELAPGVRAHQTNAISPDDFVLEIATGPGALAFADGLIRRGEGLGFVSDGLIGDDPEAVKAALVSAYGELGERLQFETLLFAHGDPVAEGGRDMLRRFVDERRA